MSKLFRIVKQNEHQRVIRNIFFNNDDANQPVCNTVVSVNLLTLFDVNKGRAVTLNEAFTEGPGHVLHERTRE